MMAPESVTIIVLNWNRKDETLACLESLRKAELRGASVIVVDNGSRDGSVDAIRDAFPEFEVLSLPENRGYAGGNNAGIRLALERGAEGVLLLNNDTEVSTDFLFPLLWTYEHFPDAGAASSAIHRFDRREMLDVAYQELRLDHRDVVRLKGVNALPGYWYEQRTEIDLAVGCCLLIRAGALRDVGLFDESLFAYFEDVDWCIRARRAGLRIFYQPLSRVFHRGSVSTSGLFRTAQADPNAPVDPELPNAEPGPWNPVRVYLGARNRVRLLAKHGNAQQKRAFLLSNLYELPLEFFAFVMHREGWMVLGRWGYKSMAHHYFVVRHAHEPMPGAIGRVVRLARDLFVSLPADILRAYRLGRIDEFAAQVRGLRDGFLNRPIPLEKLGLR